MKKLALAFALAWVAIASMPSFALAAPASDGGAGSNDPTKSNFQIVSCTGVIDPRTNKGTPCDYNQLIYTFSRIIQYALYIITPIVLGMILYTGFKYITAHGDANLVADAKRMITPIVIGVFFILAAYLIVYKFILGNLLASKAQGGIDTSAIFNPNGN